jgi:hypothetical protein
LHASPEAAECIYIFSIFSNWTEAYNQVFLPLTEDQLEAVKECLQRTVSAKEMFEILTIPFMLGEGKQYSLHAFPNWVSAFVKVIGPGVVKCEKAHLMENYSDMYANFYECCNVKTMMDEEEEEKEDCDLSSLPIEEVDKLDSQRERHEKRRMRKANLEHLLNIFHINGMTFWLMLYCFIHLRDEIFEDFFITLLEDHKILRLRTVAAIRSWRESKVFDKGEMDVYAMMTMMSYCRVKS